MSTTVYINNDLIQIVHKNGRKYKYESVQLEEGTILNGVIIEQGEVVRALKKIRNKLGQVTLIVDSSNIMVKRIQAPKLPKKKLLGLVKSEFDLGDDYEYVYDMNVLNKGKTENSILGCAVPKDFLEKYINAFAQAKIRVLRIDVAINGVIKYINKIQTFKGKTFLINIAFGNTLLSLLFEDGIYRLSNRNRMFNEPGTEAYITELYTKFSTMVQFSKSQKTEKEITQSYYIGIDGKTMRSYINYVRENDAMITVESFKDSDKNMEYIYPLMGDFVNKEDMNLKSIQKISKKAAKNNKSILIKAAVLLLVFAPFAYFGYRYGVENEKVETEIAVLEKYIETKRAANEAAGQTVLDNDQVIDELTQYSWVVENVENSKYVTSEFLSDVYGGINVDTLDYTEASGDLKITGTATSQAALVNYSAALREEGYSDAQYYSGYVVDTTTGVTAYNYSIEFLWDTVESEVVINGENEQ